MLHHLCSFLLFFNVPLLSSLSSFIPLFFLIVKFITSIRSTVETFSCASLKVRPTMYISLNRLGRHHCNYQNEHFFFTRELQNTRERQTRKYMVRYRCVHGKQKITANKNTMSWNVDVKQKALSIFFRSFFFCYYVWSNLHHCMHQIYLTMIHFTAKYCVELHGNRWEKKYFEKYFFLLFN